LRLLAAAISAKEFLGHRAQQPSTTVQHQVATLGVRVPGRAVGDMKSPLYKLADTEEEESGAQCE